MNYYGLLLALIKSSNNPVNKGFYANNLFQLVMTHYLLFPLSESIIRAKSRARIIKFLRLGNELLQCEFTNKLRNYREDIQIVCNHIAVENPTCFLCSRTLIQSYFRILSKRLSCFISNTYSVLLAIGFTDFVFDR